MLLLETVSYSRDVADRDGSPALHLCHHAGIIVKPINKVHVHARYEMVGEDELFTCWGAYMNALVWELHPLLEGNVAGTY
jgi:hypothetical protein